jgi:hypothetical protein
MQLAVVILIVHSILLFLLQLNGASPELVNKLIPDHVKRQMGLNLMHLAGTWAVKWYGIWYLAVISVIQKGGVLFVFWSSWGLTSNNSLYQDT